MEDSKIIELYFARNEQAIKETSRKYGKLCFHLARSILSDNEDAEECVNDTYLNVWNTVPPTVPVNFQAYLCSIVRNLSTKKSDYNFAQKRSKNESVSFEELSRSLSDPSVALQLEHEHVGELITSFLLQEEHLDRIVFIRKYIFFDSVSDIAAHYALTESAVKNKLYRSRKRLKKHLQNEGIEI